MLSPHTSYRWRGERVIEPIKCLRSPHTSYRWRGERVIETIKCMRSPHTSYRWRGERVMEPIKWMGILNASFIHTSELFWKSKNCMINCPLYCFGSSLNQRDIQMLISHKTCTVSKNSAMILLQMIEWVQIHPFRDSVSMLPYKHLSM